MIKINHLTLLGFGAGIFGLPPNCEGGKSDIGPGGGGGDIIPPELGVGKWGGCPSEAGDESETALGEGPELGLGK